MSKRDTVTVNCIWRASVLLYLGYELCSITEGEDRKPVYTIQCPAFDYEDINASYTNGTLALADAKQFVQSFNNLTARQKEYRRRGEQGWTNPRWIEGTIG